MAQISRDDVLSLARLSRLSLSDEEIDKFTTEISTILDYVEQLQGVDVGSLEPSYQVTGLSNVMREDEQDDYGIDTSVLLQNTPEMLDGHVKVKRMLK
ncbi:Asp-tRNA(Asn)/Glu-tRNA(Gln) amidotransferase subunit GatC [Candidatus Saccharibacteria bacterium]|jgi:aspartyl-tRNA(Asn)/glutamyl-tRNA(Gln) amidotransferase subunit C|nr:Asp-tRNA(Asn)/Glu-tRNA(Gln) amidotransferase subunit GatC [Candidatus Saccharibacteria bacterium]